MPWATFAADFTWVTRGGATERDFKAGSRHNLTRDAYAAAEAAGVLQPAESGEAAAPEGPDAAPLGAEGT